MTLTEADAKKLTVPKLKEELSKRGLSSTGKKDELLDRLLESIQKAVEDSILDGSIDDFPVPSDDILNDDLLDAPSIDGDTSKADISADDIPTDAPIVPEKTVDDTDPTTKPGVVSTEAKLARAARFGLPVAGDTAKELRAKRFGLPVATSNIVVSDDAKAKRAARFGLTSEETPSANVNPATKEKLIARAARFGLPVNADGKTTADTHASSEKLEARAKRFGVIDTDAEAKKKARLERFGAK